jgi:hypothetical protein
MPGHNCRNLFTTSSCRDSLTQPPAKGVSPAARGLASPCMWKTVPVQQSIKVQGFISRVTYANQIWLLKQTIVAFTHCSALSMPDLGCHRDPQHTCIAKLSLCTQQSERSVLDTLVQQQFSSAKGGFRLDAYAGDTTIPHTSISATYYLCWEHWHISTQIMITEATTLT